MRKIVVPLLLHIVLVILFVTSNVFIFISDIDEGLLINPSLRILDGKIPYRDFFYEHSCLDIYLIALFFALFGKSLWAARCTLLVLMLLSCAATSFLVYRASKSVVAATIASLAIFLFVAEYFYITWHWFGVFVAIVAMSVLPCSPFWAGVIAGFAGLFRETTGVFLFVAFAVYFAWENFRSQPERKSRLWSKLFYSCLGGGTVGMVFLLFLVFSGSWSGYIDSVQWACGYRLRFNAYPFLYFERQLLEHATSSHFILVAKTVCEIVTMLLIPMLLSTAWIVKLFRAGNGELTEREKAMMIIVIGYLALFFSSLYRPDFRRLCVFPSPLALAVLVFSADAAIHSWQKRPRTLHGALCLAGTGIIVLLMGCIMPSKIDEIKCRASKEQRGILVANSRSTVYLPLAEEIEAVKNVLDSSPDSTTFVYYIDPILYFLYGKRNATSFDFYIPEFNAPAHVDRIIEELAAQKPTYIVKDRYVERLKDPNDVLYWSFPKVDRRRLDIDPVDVFVCNHYEVEKMTPNFMVFRLKNSK